MTVPTPAMLAYHAGCCALCDGAIEDHHATQEVRLHVFGPAGSVALRCWLGPVCRPTPATLLATSITLLQRLLGWYGSTPSAWPSLRLAPDD